MNVAAPVPVSPVPASPAGSERLLRASAVEPLAPAWDELAGRLGAPPFLRPGWIAAWWRAFGRGALEIRALERDGRLAGVLPLVRRRGALRAAMNCHTPQFGLLAEDPGAASALARSLFAGGPRRVSIASLAAADPGLGTCRRAAEEAGYRLLVRRLQRSPYLEVDGDWEGYESGLSRNLAIDLRRSRRRLEALGELSFEAADGRERLEELLREAFAVEASGWKGRRGTAIRSRADTRRFYTEIARWAAGEGALRLFFLRLDRRAIAMYYALETAGVRHLLKGGYDPAWRRFSPGKLLMREVLAHGFATGVSRIELHGSAEAYKLRWARAVQERKLFEAFSPSPAGRLAWTVLAYGRPAARRLLRGRPGGSIGSGAAPLPEPSWSDQPT